MVYSIFYLFQCTKSLQIEHHIWQDTSTSIKSDTNTLFRKNIGYFIQYKERFYVDIKV